MDEGHEACLAVEEAAPQRHVEEHRRSAKNFELTRYQEAWPVAWRTTC